MGLTISSLLTRLFGKKQMRILMGTFHRKVISRTVALATKMRNDKSTCLLIRIATQLWFTHLNVLLKVLNAIIDIKLI